MGKKLYAGNLSYGITAADLEQLFAAHGSVISAQVITDRETQRSKGFGFVEMASEQEALAAIEALHGVAIEGRALTVNEARPQERRGAGGHGGGRRGPGSGTRGPYGPSRGGSGGGGRY